MLSGPFVMGVLLAGSVLAWPRAGPSPRRRELLRVGRPVSPARPMSGGGRGAGRPGAWTGQGGLLAQRVRRVRGRGPAAAKGVALEREVLGLVEGLAAVLRAGLTPSRALRHLATGMVEFDGSVVAGAGAGGGSGGGGSALGEMQGLVAVLADQAESGARLEPVWRAAAERLGSPALTAMAEGWGLSERHGAPVVPVLDALVAALRDDARVAAAIEASLAAPRATAALLGVLPIGGVLLGELVGVHPIAVLVSTGIGRIALCAGLIATLGGRLWMTRLVRAAEVR